jgi:hypothetical protein
LPLPRPRSSLSRRRGSTRGRGRRMPCEQGVGLLKVYFSISGCGTATCMSIIQNMMVLPATSV